MELSPDAKIVHLSANFADDPDVQRLSLKARWGYVEMMCYCRRHETDGEYLAAGKLPAYYEELIAAGLLEEIGHPVYRLPAYLKWNHSKADLKSIRERGDSRSAGAKRAARVRWDAVRNGGAPARRISANVKNARDADMYLYTPEFELFWEKYPLRKDKRKAAAAFANALERAPLAEIVAGAERYRDDPDRAPAFTKYAEGWLNDDRWTDEASTVAGKSRLSAEIAAAAARRQERDRG